MEHLKRKAMAEHSVSDTVLPHAWLYFELHANQRMPVFNFSLALSGVYQLV